MEDTTKTRELLDVLGRIASELGTIGDNLWWIGLSLALGLVTYCWLDKKGH